MQQIADLSANSTHHEKAAISSIVKSALRRSVADQRNGTTPAVSFMVNSDSASSLHSMKSDDNKTPTHLTQSVRAITSLLSGLQSKAKGDSFNEDSSMKLGIKHDDLGVDGAASNGDDSMQFSPDRGSANSSQKQSGISGFRTVGKEMVSKLNVARMFSVQEEDNEDFSARPAPRKVTLSRFHDEEEAQYRHLQQLDDLQASATLVQTNQYGASAMPSAIQSVQPHHMPSFSTAGFRFGGEQATVADSGSMLHRLRQFGGVEGVGDLLPVAVQRGEDGLSGDQSSAAIKPQLSMLLALRSLSQPNSSN